MRILIALKVRIRMSMRRFHLQHPRMKYQCEYEISADYSRMRMRILAPSQQYLRTVPAYCVLVRMLLTHGASLLCTRASATYALCQLTVYSCVCYLRTVPAYFVLVRMLRTYGASLQCTERMLLNYALCQPTVYSCVC